LRSLSKQLSRSHVLRVWKSRYLYTITEISRSARPICFFATKYPLIPSRKGGGGGVYEILFWRKGARTAPRSDAGVRASGGQPGSGAMARCSLAVAQPREFQVSLGVEARSYAGRGRIAAGGATRSGGGGPQDRPPPNNNRHGEFSNTYFRTRYLLRSANSISEFDQ
jgi:hypothetical protein